jgi:hypothetical protein
MCNWKIYCKEKGNDLLRRRNCNLTFRRSEEKLKLRRPLFFASKMDNHLKCIIENDDSDRKQGKNRVMLRSDNRD